MIWESNNCLHHALLRNRNIVHTLLVTFQWHSWMSFFTQSIKRTTLEHQQHRKMTGALHNGPKSEILFTKFSYLKFVVFVFVGKNWFFTESIKRTTLEHQQHKKMTGALHNGLKSEILFTKFSYIFKCVVFVVVGKNWNFHSKHKTNNFGTPAAQEDDRSL